MYREIIADLETPVSAFLKLTARDGAHAFLLESVTGGEQIARYSYMGVRPAAVISTKGREVLRIVPDESESSWSLPEGQDPLHLLKGELTHRAYVPIEGWERFSGGAVGFLGYDVVRFFETLPDSTVDDLGLPDCAFMITGTVVIFDHVQHKIRVLANVPYEGGDPNLAYDRGVAEIEETVETLRAPLVAPRTEASPSVGEVQCNFERDDFERAVIKAKEYIAAGDCIQVVLSQRFSTRISAHPFTVYRALRSVSPAPYMFYLAFDELKIVGASPEILVSEDRGEVLTRPLAGTRPRGATPEEDLALEKELLADEKERAEHIMLVDLARNDIGRVCSYGSVRVDELLFVDRWSHVMHIVSNVRGTLMPGKDQFDLLRATFPAGTLSGAPKIRAMEIIDELEPTRRGPYGGAIGYFSYSGSMDTAITIRTAVISGDTAHVQVGAGIVADSVPAREYEETQHKARAALLAIRKAEEGLE
ncbi:MAG: anthranilate synthase component I [Armatimonadota bacterium]